MLRKCLSGKGLRVSVCSVAKTQRCLEATSDQPGRRTQNLIPEGLRSHFSSNLIVGAKKQRVVVCPPHWCFAREFLVPASGGVVVIG